MCWQRQCARAKADYGGEGRPGSGCRIVLFGRRLLFAGLRKKAVLRPRGPPLLWLIELVDCKKLDLSPSMDGCTVTVPSEPTFPPAATSVRPRLGRGMGKIHCKEGATAGGLRHLIGGNPHLSHVVDISSDPLLTREGRYHLSWETAKLC